MESMRRIDLIEHSPAAVRGQVAAMMDELSRPMTPRELETELVPYYTRKKAKEIVKALGFFRVVLLLPAPSAPQKHRRSRSSDGTASAP